MIQTGTQRDLIEFLHKHPNSDVACHYKPDGPRDGKYLYTLYQQMVDSVTNAHGATLARRNDWQDLGLFDPGDPVDDELNVALRWLIDSRFHGDEVDALNYVKKKFAASNIQRPSGWLISLYRQAKNKTSV